MLVKPSTSCAGEQAVPPAMGYVSNSGEDAWEKKGFKAQIFPPNLEHLYLHNEMAEDRDTI